MLCDRCGKNRATIHLKEVVNGQVTALNLCPDCAAAATGNGTDIDGGEVDLAALVLSLAAEHAPDPTPEPGIQGDSAGRRSCSACGLTAAEFRRTGRLGCAECYRTFANVLAPALVEMHRAARHVGKTLAGTPGPGAASDENRGDLAQLEEELARAVAAEAYERAAKIRDLIEHDRNEPECGRI